MLTDMKNLFWFFLKTKQMLSAINISRKSRLQRIFCSILVRVISLQSSNGNCCKEIPWCLDKSRAAFLKSNMLTTGFNRDLGRTCCQCIDGYLNRCPVYSAAYLFLCPTFSTLTSQSHSLIAMQSWRQWQLLGGIHFK